jgi:hypothetical protein
MKRWAIIFLLVMPTLAPAQRHWRRGYDYTDSETQNRSFGVSAGSTLTVDHISGDVHITAGSSGTVNVSVVKSVGAESNTALLRGKQEVTLDMSQQGSEVRLYEDGPFRHGGDNGRRGYEVSFDYEIQVPADVVLNVKTVNGGVVVKGTSGDYKVSGVNGGIEMDAVAGSGSVHTVNGPIRVTFTRNPSKAMNFHSVNGTIEAHFQPGLNADLSFQTVNGGVYSDFDVTVGGAGGAEIGRRLTRARVGSGGLAMDFQTVNGTIKLYTK